MSALKLIVQREYTSRVQKKSFLLVTIFMPLIVVGLVVGTLFLAQIKDSEVKKIVVIDNVGIYGSHLQDSEYYKFEIAQDTSKEAKPSINEETFGTIIISSDLGKEPNAVTLYSEKQPPADLMLYMTQVFGEVVKDKRLKELTLESNLDPTTVKAVQQITEAPNSVKINTVRLKEDGSEKETSTNLATAIAWITTMVMYMFVFSYGSMVMQGVVEEKSNRIVEVMISSIRPFDLMMGKIIGICLVGITQLLIWTVLCAVLFKVAIGAFLPEMPVGSITDMVGMMSSVNWFEIVIFFFLFFIGGYLMYASLFAMFGSAVDNVQDSQQFVMPVTIVFIFALYAGIYSVQNPDGPLAFWCSMIPLTSPVVMMVRIPFGIPLWESLLSVAILYITAIVVVQLAAKVYRVGILMYGKKPSFMELLKWMRYK